LDEQVELAGASHKGKKQGITMVDGSISSNKTDTAEQLRQSAREYVQAKRWAEARSAYAALLSNDKEDEDALTGLAGALEKLADYEAMYEAAQDAVQANPGSARALAYKARALQKLERLSEATIANDQALLLDTNLALAWFNRSGQQLLQPCATRNAPLNSTPMMHAPGPTRDWLCCNSIVYMRH